MDTNGESDRKIEFTQAELAMIEFRPGDTAALLFPRKLSMEQIQQLKEVWNSYRPDVKCVILDDGARLGVIRATVDE